MQELKGLITAPAECNLAQSHVSSSLLELSVYHLPTLYGISAY